jgi:transcriptional regulator with XRE-family HTH domain
MSNKKIDTPNIIGSAVHAARKASKLTLRELGSKVGTSAGNLSDIENGKSVPGGELLISIQRTLNINIVGESEQKYEVAQVVQGLTPAEYEMIRIARECPEAVAVVRMMGAVDSDTQKDIQHDVEKAKRIFDKMKELQERKAV